MNTANKEIIEEFRKEYFHPTGIGRALKHRGFYSGVEIEEWLIKALNAKDSKNREGKARGECIHVCSLRDCGQITD